MVSEVAQLYSTQTWNGSEVTSASNALAAVTVVLSHIHSLSSDPWEETVRFLLVTTCHAHEYFNTTVVD